MAPNGNQGNAGSLQSCLQSAPRALRAMTTSENPAEKDRADAKMELLALRRQTKKDKEKARKRRRKLGMNETMAVAVTAAATVDESEGKTAAAAAARAASIGEVAMAQGAAAANAEPEESQEEAATRAAGTTSIGQVVAVAGAGAAAAAAAAVEDPGEARATSALGKGSEPDSSSHVAVEGGVPVAEAVAPASSPSLTTTTAGGDSANKQALAGLRLRNLLQPMVINFRQSRANQKEVTIQLAAAKAAEPAEESAAAAAAAAAAAQSKVHEDERATAERACVEQAALKTLSTGILTAQAKENASANNKIQPVLSLPPVRKHAADRPSKALTLPTAAEGLQLLEARELWTARFQSSCDGLEKARDASGMRVF